MIGGLYLLVTKKGPQGRWVGIILPHSPSPHIQGWLVVVHTTPPCWQVAPSAWRSNGLGIFSPTIDFLTLKKKFIYNCRYNEPFLLFDKPYRVSQKKVHKAFDVWMVPPCQFGRQIAPLEGAFSVIDTQTNPAFDSTFRQSVDCGFFVKSPKVYDNSVIVLFTF